MITDCVVGPVYKRPYILKYLFYLLVLLMNGITNWTCNNQKQVFAMLIESTFCIFCTFIDYINVLRYTNITKYYLIIIFYLFLFCYKIDN